MIFISHNPAGMPCKEGTPGGLTLSSPAVVEKTPSEFGFAFADVRSFALVQRSAARRRAATTPFTRWEPPYVPKTTGNIAMRNAVKVLAISSGGGHWEQLMLLRDGLSAAQVVYVNTIQGLAEKAGVSPAYVVADCNRTAPIRNFRCLIQVLGIVVRERPNVVISTGAAPGLLGLAIGKVMGARTIWIDSVANSEQLSLSGRLAGWIADLWITQWRRLAKDTGPHYFGSVL